MSALPWSAVIARSAPGAPGSSASTASIAATTRPRQPSTTSRAAIVASQTPRVADHVGVGVVRDDEVVAAGPIASTSASVTPTALIAGSRSYVATLGLGIRRRSSPG